MYIQERQNSNKTFPISNQKQKDGFNINQKHLFPLEKKITSLENNFMKIEEEYLNKIKQLQAILTQKTKKQVSLTSQVINLRENFRLHKQQIKKLTQECNQQISKQVDSSNSKKSSRYFGIVRKSLDSQRKKIDNQSPSNTPKTKQSSRNQTLQNTKSQQNCQKTAMKSINLFQTLLASDKKSIYTTRFSKSNDKMQKSNRLISNNIQKQKNEKIKEQQNKRRSFGSIIGSKLKKCLLQSIKNVQPQKVKIPILNNAYSTRIFTDLPTSQIKNAKNTLNQQILEDKGIEIQNLQECF